MLFKLTTPYHLPLNSTPDKGSGTNSLYQDLYVLIYLHAHHINTASLDRTANFCTYCPHMWLKMATDVILSISPSQMLEL